MVNRTQQEILDQIELWKDNDFFGVKRLCLIQFLDYENAKQFLNEGVTEEEWQEDDDNITPENEIARYMSFAWEKANDCRGLSASRSYDRFTAWVWLINDPELQDGFDEIEYEYYGKPTLVYLCEHFGIDWRALDSGLWGNDELNQLPRKEVWWREKG